MHSLKHSFMHFLSFSRFLNLSLSSPPSSGKMSWICFTPHKLHLSWKLLCSECNCYAILTLKQVVTKSVTRTFNPHQPHSLGQRFFLPFLRAWRWLWSLSQRWVMGSSRVATWRIQTWQQRSQNITKYHKLFSRLLGQWISQWSSSTTNLESRK